MGQKSGCRRHLRERLQGEGLQGRCWGLPQQGRMLCSRLGDVVEEDLLSASKETKAVCMCVGGCRGGKEHVTHILCQEVISSFYWSNNMQFFLWFRDTRALPASVI